MPFNRVLLAIKAEADHTGCIYLVVSDSIDNRPLAVYGGPKEASFTWHILDDGSLSLSELITDENDAQTRGSYGDNMTDVSNTNMNYTTDGNITVINGSYSSTLAKANAEKEAEIWKTLSTLLSATNLSSEDNITINETPEGTGFWSR